MKLPRYWMSGDFSFINDGKSGGGLGLGWNWGGIGLGLGVEVGSCWE